MKQFFSFESMETKNLKDSVFEKIYMGFQLILIVEEENSLVFPKLWNVVKIPFRRLNWKKVVFFWITFCCVKKKKLMLVILTAFLWALYFRHLGMQE